MNHAHRRTVVVLTERGRMVVATLALALCLWAPRAPALDQFVTADEHAWLARSGNFYSALLHGDWANTFQRHHPGVTVTWAGLGGFLLSYPGYAWDAPGQFGWLTEEIEPFLRSQGHDPVDVLAAGRAVVVVIITVTLLAVFWTAVPLIGFWPAFLGVGLIAFDPFHLAHSRLLHLDGLVSSWMLLAVTGWLLYLRNLLGCHSEEHALSAANGSATPCHSEESATRNLSEMNIGSREIPRQEARNDKSLTGSHTGRPSRALIVSASAAGLAWLTRSPALFLGPLVVLLALLAALWLPARGSPRPWGRLVRALALWGLIAAGVFVLLWPAMWVDPLGSIRQVLDAAEEYAAEGHLKPTFFAGRIYAGDPGLLFYPVTYLWRGSPITWLGLLLALGVWALRRPPLDERRGRFVATALLVYALGFMLFMDIGAKKFDRYLLPAYLPLDLLAGMGWGALLLWARQRAERVGTLRYLPLFAGSLVAAQAALALPFFPYYLSYYNPLLGGTARAPQVMMIGWGEGADVAGRYLAAKPNAAQLTVASGYTNGPFSYFFPGRTLPITFWHEADYAVVYAQDRQRQLPSRRSAAYFEHLTPEKVVTLNGIDYAYIYDLRGAPLPSYVTDWGGEGTPAPAGAIRLVTFQLPAASITPGETVPAVFYLLNQTPIAANLNVLVRVAGADGREIARDEGWPWGAATSSWAQGVVWPDGHSLTIPADTPPGYYRVELGFYDPATQALLPAVQPATGAALGDLVTVDTILVGELPAPTQRFDPPVALGNELWLQGVDVSPGSAALHPGDTLAVQLHWQAQRRPDHDYTAFVHLVGPDGTLAAQMDKPPLDGFLPTGTWYPDQIVVDRFRLTVPTAAPPGEYRVLTGLYDPATGTRLPVSQGDAAQGDAFLLGTVTVAEP